MMNVVCLQGRLTKDPETRSTKNGSTVASFTLACDRDFQPGGAEKLTDFVDCSAWRNTAGFVERNFRKGMMVCVYGHLHSRKWQDKTGANRVSWEITVEDTWFCGDRPAAKEAVDVQVGFNDLPDDDGGSLPF